MKGRAAATLCSLVILSTFSLAQGMSGMDGMQPGSHSSFNHAGILTGRVINSAGTPLQDVKVEVETEGAGTVASTYTDSNGLFQIAGVPPGRYVVVASSGVFEARDRVMVSQLDVNVVLRMDTGQGAASQADGKVTVSVSEYKVPQKARDTLHKAEAAMSKGNLPEAHKQVDKALELYPNYAAALTLRGALFLDAKDSTSAMADFDKAIHVDPSYAMAYTAMGAALNQQGKYPEAIRECERASSLDAAAWQPYFEMAKAFASSGDFQKALQLLARTQQTLTKDFAPLHLMRAHVLLAMQNYQDAVVELQAFLNLSPSSPNAGPARATLEKVKAMLAANTAPPPAMAIR
jgi:Tfp pilus assembly protein PilF